MRLSRLFFVVAILLASFSCDRDNPLFSPHSGDITLSITLPQGEARLGTINRLGKVVAITTVTITVTASDMETIEKSLSISSDGNTASGTIEVPKGDARTFAIEAKDGSGIVQYSGSTTQDILNNSETVTIITEGHYPSASSITITGFNAQAVGLSWAANADADFDAYEVVRVGPAEALTSSSTWTSIAVFTNRSTTAYTDTTVSQNNNYYYAVVVWDTEDLGWQSAAKNVTTPREFLYTDSPLFIPDDGWAYSYYIDNSFAPSGAVVTKVEYQVRIDDTGDPTTFWSGDYQIYISSSTAPLASPDDALVYNNLGDWTDGGFDDDIDDDTDIWLNWRSTSYFNGESPNQYWGVYIIDNLTGDAGQMDYIDLRIYYRVPTAGKAVVEGQVSSGSITMTGLDDGVARYELRTVDKGQTTGNTRAGAGSRGAGAGVRIEKLR